MNKRGSILIIVLWIMAMLVVFAIGLGHRASVNLKLSGYQRDRLKAHYLAKSGVAQGISELKKKPLPAAYDSLNETWSSGEYNNKKVFEKVTLNPKYDGSFTLTCNDPLSGQDYCMIDEERKINLNKIDVAEIKAQVKKVFEDTDIGGLVSNEAQTVADIISGWVGNPYASPSGPEPEEKKLFKGKKLNVLEELLFILECYYYFKANAGDQAQDKAQELYNKVKDYFTVYGSGKININTASNKILANLININSAGSAPAIPADGMADAIIQYRTAESTGPLKDLNVIDNTTIFTETAQQTLLQKFKTDEKIDIKSNFFKINSTGIPYKEPGKVSKNITAIFNRKDNKIVYWHEK